MASVRSYKDLLEDVNWVFTRASHKEVYKTLVKIFIYVTDVLGCTMKLLRDVREGPL